MAARATLALLCLTAGFALASLLVPATAEEPSPGVVGPAGVAVARSHNYDLDDYRRIPQQARGTVALARRPSHRVLASGVLVATDLALTCRHCTHLQNGGVKRWRPEDLEVQIVSEDGTRRVFPVLAFAYTSETYDLCVLSIGPDRAGELPEADRVRALSRLRVPLDAPLYVAHHPRGGKLVIGEDTRVLFPYEATSAERDLMVERLRRQAAGSDHGEELVEALLGSYRPVGDGLWRNFSRRWAGQPVLGADCPTLPGSSGAPVYDKRTHALVGILFAGVDETRERIPSTWEHHEAVLPAAAILEDLAGSSDPRIRRLACSKN